MSTILITGFPGFLGSGLLPQILLKRPQAQAICIVQGQYAELAATRLRALEEAHPEMAGRTSLATGDIARPDLGLRSGALDLAKIREVYHLAAVYDLTVNRDLAMRVNVAGTRHVADVAESCPGLERLHYMSTCFVSGDYDGVFTEDDLDVGQGFQNYYEETKFLAEMHVQERMRDGLPATVYRPAIVVGDSRTGETQKLDGPYFVIKWVLRTRRVSLLPIVADPTRVQVNLVPSDFAIDAIAHLGSLEKSVGRVYQIADPDPCTLAELLDLVSQATGRRLIKVRVPASIARMTLRALPVIGIPAPAVDYFRLPTRHPCEHTTADLAGSGIEAPPFSSYVSALTDFAQANPGVSGDPMI